MPADGDCAPDAQHASRRREETMSRLSQPFRRLHWQLTLTYVVITLAAALTIEATNIIANAAKAKQPAVSAPDLLLDDMGWVAPQVAPYLDAAAPNNTALTALATNLVR